MSTSIQHIKTSVTTLIEPIVEDLGFELLDIEYVSNLGRWTLRLYIDKRNGGVTIDDCVRVSREISDLINVKDMIQHAYVLEVSSPGLNRPLRKEKDFLWAMGKKIKLRMDEPVEGRRNYTGYLRDFKEKTLYLEVDGRIVLLPWMRIEKANLVYEF